MPRDAKGCQVLAGEKLEKKSQRGDQRIIFEIFAPNIKVVLLIYKNDVHLVN